MLSLHGRALARSLNAFAKLLSANAVSCKPVQFHSCKSQLKFPAAEGIFCKKADTWAGSTASRRLAFLALNMNPTFSRCFGCQKPQLSAEFTTVPTMGDLGKLGLASHAGCLLSQNSKKKGECQEGQSQKMYSTDSKNGAEREVAGGTEGSSKEESVHIAIGGNIGDRLANLHRGLELMRAAGIKTGWTSNLYESAPAYVTDQPAFLNAVIEARTTLAPLDLLRALKKIEAEMGRDFQGQRFGPRPLDLDILYYGKQESEVEMKTDELEIPHPRISERGFVIQPLEDLVEKDCDHFGVLEKRVQLLAEERDVDLTHKFEQLLNNVKEALLSLEDPSRRNLVRSMANIDDANRRFRLLSEGMPGGLERVFPLNGKLRNPAAGTLIMGILNVTPDSFSDGGKFDQTEEAVAQAQKLAEEGADIIDIGGQSTRPGATRLNTEEELARVIPVIKRLAAEPDRLQGASISIDTFDSKVAKAAVEAGAHMVNDVSGGSLDPDMYSTVAKLGVPYVLMHMRGDPTTMQSETNTRYEDVAEEVANELVPRIRAAIEAGIPLWNLILDPGVGFSKKGTTNCQLIRDIPELRQTLRTSGVYGLANVPILIGPSRKKFLGDITGIKKAERRDVPTAAAVAVAIKNGANIVRVHNVAIVKKTVKVIEAIEGST